MKKSVSFSSLLTICLFAFSNQLFAQINNAPFKQNMDVIARRTDTLVYKASAFVIQPNDKLDDLLKRLPNITIDNQGKLYAQQEKVQQLLVDGNEFFSDDPVSAAHVLRADKVDQIRIYWRWSDQSSFTGVEDNAKIKTINVILKK
ncbi:hypothetical protein ACFQZS_02155 [Mucilaginibacter calamicampi]|uniref:Uncharacterized protein n=1 Tax=Mucilaginibacter calamicampi TaxID=1302352 RepID=A0ABW2YWL0_9SPHI